MKEKSITLHNIIFPIWVIWMLPTVWIIVLPANFIIDFLVVAVTMKVLRVEQIMKKAGSVILKVWIMGFIADFIGTILLFLITLIDSNRETKFGGWWSDVTQGIYFNPFQNIGSILIVTVCVFLTGYFIYLLNRKICLKQVELPEEQKKKIALSLAIFTAPYLFYVPTNWFL